MLMIRLDLLAVVFVGHHHGHAKANALSWKNVAPILHQFLIRFADRPDLSTEVVKAERIY